MNTYVIQWFNIANWGQPIAVKEQTPMAAIKTHWYAKQDSDNELTWQVIEVVPDSSGDVMIYNGTLPDVEAQYRMEDEE